ncbi:hypothetical protein LXL04_008754 [Taraxacum kok-saghyz]
MYKSLQLLPIKPRKRLYKSRRSHRRGPAARLCRWQSLPLESPIPSTSPAVNSARWHTAGFLPAIPSSLRSSNIFRFFFSLSKWAMYLYVIYNLQLVRQIQLRQKEIRLAIGREKNRDRWNIKSNGTISKNSVPPNSRNSPVQPRLKNPNMNADLSSLSTPPNQLYVVISSSNNQIDSTQLKEAYMNLTEWSDSILLLVPLGDSNQSWGFGFKWLRPQSRNKMVETDSNTQKTAPEEGFRFHRDPSFSNWGDKDGIYNQNDVQEGEIANTSEADDNFELPVLQKVNDDQGNQSQSRILENI